VDKKQLETMMGRELTFKELERIGVGVSLYNRSIEVIYNTFEHDIAENIMGFIEDGELYI